MVTARGDRGDALPEREIILCLPNKNQTALSQIFKENQKVPTKVLRQKLGRRQYEYFRDQILTINKHLKSKGILEPFQVYWTPEFGREQKAIQKRENTVLETGENCLFITVKS